MNTTAKKKILIVCHIFPPTAGIGGRRWAKFAKYLQRNGAQVKVLASDQKTEEQSTWIDDVRNIEVEYYPHKYPKTLDTVPQSFSEKIAYRFWVKWLKLWTRGNIYDRALLIENEFYTALKKCLYAYKPDVVIASGAPFRLLYYTSLLKLEFPDIYFAADIRDPWTWGNLYGYFELSGKKRSWELLMEARVMQRFDKIFTVSDVIANHLKSCYPDEAGKIEELPHAFDPDDLALINSLEYAPKVSNARLRIIYGGTLYENLDDILVQMLKAAEAHPKDLEFNLFTDPQQYHSLLENRPGNVTLMHRVAATQYAKQVKQHDAVLLFILPRFKDLITTKILEIRSMGKPILAVGASGKASEFIEQNGYGIFLKPSELNAYLDTIISGSNQLPVLKDIDMDAHNYQHVTQQLIQSISQPVAAVIN